MQLSTRIALSFIMLVVLTTGVLLGVIGFEKQNLQKSLSTELKEQIRIRTSEILKPVYKLCEVKESQTIPLLQKDLKSASYLLARMGGMSLADDLVPWKVINSDKKQVAELPMMLIGEEWFGVNTDPNSPSPIVDDIQQLSGVHCSIYQRVNQEGDMINVCTSMLTAGHQRAVGSLVSHLDPDGEPNKLIKDILSGRQYQERASYANDWTTLMCEPIRNVMDEEIIGSLCVSISQKNTVEPIREIILKTAIGKSGYMWVLGSKGERRGVYIVSKDGLRDGEDLWHFQDENGNYFVQSIVQKALQTKNGEAQFYRYPWKNPEDSHPRMKIAAFTYFEPWDWIIGSSAYEDDFQEPQIRVDTTLRHMLYFTFLTGLALIFCSMLVGLFVQKTIHRFTEEREQQNWLEMSLNELSEKIRGEQEVDQLVHSILDRLAASLNIQIGVIYLSQAPDRLVPSATFGVAAPEKTTPVIRVGEGLVGQVAANRKTMYIEAPRETPLMISTGFGDVLPRSIIITPLVHENEVMGVIQLGALVPFDEIHQTFLEQAAEAITITIYTAQSRAEVNNLLEKTQKQTQELERISRFKSNFMANMSHELRTPLNAILGFSELMTRDTTLSAEQRNNLNTINRSGEHLLSLINNVLELSKLEAGHLEVLHENFDLHNLILGLEEMFRLRTSKKGLRLDIMIAANVPQYIQADQNKLRQILINLLGNAVKFTGKGGSVTLELKRGSGKHSDVEFRDLKVSSQPPVIDFCMLVIEVADTGIGIAEEDLGKVFNPFFQSTAEQSQQGTGLGLSISNGFAQAMGGDLSVASELGVGTTFTLTIPVAIINGSDLVESFPTRRVAGLEHDQPSFRILVAEDDMASRNLLVKLLKNIGFEVREAVNGLQAVELWKKWEPQFIWMDFKMPVMDGEEATKRIKNTAQGKDTKIVALTASVFEEDRVRILAQGCDDFLRKPFRESEIFEMLNKHLGVRYVYYENESDNSQCQVNPERYAEDLIKAIGALSAEILARLTEATELGDAIMIERIIEEVRDKDEHLADTLASLANNFDYDEIIDLVHNVRQKGLSQQSDEKKESL